MGCVLSALFLAALLLDAPAAARLDVEPQSALIDEPVAIVLRGVAPGSRVTISLRGWGETPRWSSQATFVADAGGVVDLTRMAPVSGDYAGVDAMGLLWSAHRDSFAPSPAARQIDTTIPPPEVWRLTASAGGEVVATASLERRALAPDVTMAAVRDGGLAGVFYQPPTGGRHPAVLVVGGSGGGVLPASSFPGGLASRGYAVLSLAYFGIGDLPPRLHDIPLEYFATALQWLAAQPSVDPHRIAVLGISRGGELALLLGAHFPQVRAVVAYVPSNVVVGGCCTGRPESSWTIAGRPLMWAYPGQRNAPAALAAAIPVERIKGAVLLVSGRADGVWPSTAMSDAVMARLERNHFPFSHQHLAYADAGHSFSRPFVPATDISHAVHPLTGRAIVLGGTVAGTARARADAWQNVLAFLARNLHQRD